MDPHVCTTTRRQYLDDFKVESAFPSTEVGTPRINKGKHSFLSDISNIPQGRVIKRADMFQRVL